MNTSATVAVAAATRAASGVGGGYASSSPSNYLDGALAGVLPVQWAEAHRLQTFRGSAGEETHPALRALRRQGALPLLASGCPAEGTRSAVAEKPPGERGPLRCDLNVHERLTSSSRRASCRCWPTSQALTMAL